MSVIDRYSHRLLESYSAYPRGRFVTVLLIREIESEAIFRTEGSGEPLNKEFVFAGERPGDDELIQRVVISKRKQTAVERRIGRELLREHDLLRQSSKGICSLNTNNPCEKCIDCMVYGYAAGGGGAQRSRVITDDASSMHSLIIVPCAILKHICLLPALGLMNISNHSQFFWIWRRLRILCQMSCVISLAIFCEQHAMELSHHD